MLIKNKKWKNYILLSLALTAAVFVFEIIPRYSDIISLSLDLYSRSVETEEAAKNTKLESNLSEENKKLKQSIKGLISSYEDNQKISSVISFLDEAAYGKGVDIASIKPGKTEKKENLWVQPVAVELDSDYEGIFNFIRHVEKSSKVILIKELVYTPKIPLSDSLRVKASLEVYLNL